jgi:hypothetical protein
MAQVAQVPSRKDRVRKSVAVKNINKMNRLKHLCVCKPQQGPSYRHECPTFE